jgi:hypothetical protein
MDTDRGSTKISESILFGTVLGLVGGIWIVSTNATTYARYVDPIWYAFAQVTACVLIGATLGGATHLIRRMQLGTGGKIAAAVILMLVTNFVINTATWLIVQLFPALEPVWNGAREVISCAL